MPKEGSLKQILVGGGGIPFGTYVSSAAWEIALDASNAKIQTWTSHKTERFTVCNNFLISDKKKKKQLRAALISFSLSSLIDISTIKMFQMCQLNAEILIKKNQEY